MCALFEKDGSANWIFGRSLNASDGTSRNGRFSAKMEEDWRKFVLECEEDARIGLTTSCLVLLHNCRLKAVQSCGL